MVSEEGLAVVQAEDDGGCTGMGQGWSGGEVRLGTRLGSGITGTTTLCYRVPSAMC